MILINIQDGLQCVSQGWHIGGDEVSAFSQGQYTVTDNLSR